MTVGRLRQVVCHSLVQLGLALMLIQLLGLKCRHVKSVEIGQYRVCSEESHRPELYLKWAWVGSTTSTSVRIKIRTSSKHDNSFTLGCDEPDKDEDKSQKRESSSRKSSLPGAVQQTTSDLKLTLQLSTAEHIVRTVDLFLNSTKRDYYLADPLTVHDLVVNKLLPTTEYRFTASIRWREIVLDETAGRFSTPGPEHEPFNFSFAFASCADTLSNSVVFDSILLRRPSFFFHTGDLHYGDINENNRSKYYDMLDRTLEKRSGAGSEKIVSYQNNFFKSLPVYYMFDDHDYGPNNSDKLSPGRKAALRWFRDSIPTPPLQFPDKMSSLPVCYSFVIGRVKYIVTDLRSARDSRPPGRTVLGREQREWFLEELTSAYSQESAIGLVVWVNTMPWISETKWGAFPEEQTIIAEHIARLKAHRNEEQHKGIKKEFIMLCGDAHMVAYDNGEHSPGGVPVFHAAALDAKPTSKGGPYSHGIYPGRGQYGLIDIVDHGLSQGICVKFEGVRVHQDRGAALPWRDEALLQIDFCDTAASSPRNRYEPSPVFLRRIWKWIKQALFKSKHSLVPRWLGDRIMTAVDERRSSLYMDLLSFSITALFPILAAIIAISLIRASVAR